MFVVYLCTTRGYWFTSPRMFVPKVNPSQCCWLVPGTEPKDD